MRSTTLPGISFFLAVCLLTASFGQTSPDIFPVKRQESAETWRRDGWSAIDQRKSLAVRKGKAKNVILFIGDGMGVSTLTAAADI